MDSFNLLNSLGNASFQTNPAGPGDEVFQASILHQGPTADPLAGDPMWDREMQRYPELLPSPPKLGIADRPDAYGLFLMNEYENLEMYLRWICQQLSDQVRANPYLQTLQLRNIVAKNAK
jgi:hypothetical protein